MNSTCHLAINNLSFSRNQRLLFDDLCFEFGRGKITAILGPSGIGKTTLLKLIGGQLQADSGEIWFNKTAMALLYFSKKEQNSSIHITTNLNQNIGL